MKDVCNKNMKAMIMAAGVGSRLDPLTQAVPKPLVPVCNRPVMDILLEKLSKIGVRDVIANTYYLAEKIIKRYSDNPFGINFNYIKEETLSGTAGGLKKCQYFFNEGDDFIVLSADGLTNADLQQGIDVHKRSGAIATIGIKAIPIEEVSHFGVVVTDKNGFISEFQEKPAVNEAKSNFINTGIYIFNYKIFDYIPADTFYDFAKNVFPKLLEDKQINTFEISEYWTDIGTLDQYKQSTKDLFAGECSFNHTPIVNTKNGSYISETKINASLTNIVGNSTIGKNCKIGKNVTIKDSIIWDDVILSDGITIENSVIGSNSKIQADVKSEIIGSDKVVNINLEKDSEKLLIF